MRQRNYQAILFLSIESFGSIVGLLSILKTIHFLFFGQIIGAIGFALLLVVIFPSILDYDIK
jgi:hypothetical protein